MTPWTMFVEWLQVALFVISQLYGGSMGLAIISLSMAVRLGLLPLTVKLSRRALKHQALTKKLQPELERLRIKYKDKPQKLAQKTSALYKRHNASPVDVYGFLGALVQAPLLIGLFSAIRKGAGAGKQFFWIVDLAKPDLILVVIAGILTYISTIISPNLAGQHKTLSVLLPTILTMFFVWRIAAGIGLYLATFSFAGIVEKIILRHSLKKYPIEGVA